MVYVVERYLPGLSHSELLRGLSKLEQLERAHEVPNVRYLDSTIVLGDEACFCRFEGPTEAAVAEANRTAGLPFDRIVPAVTVQPERRTTMNVSTTIPASVQIGRGRLLGLIGGVAVLAAAITWIVFAFAVDTGSEEARASSTGVPVTLAPTEQSVGFCSGVRLARSRPAQSVRQYLSGTATALTPAEQSVGFYLFGASDSLTPAQLESVRQYLSGAVTALTPAEQSVGFYLFGASDSLTPAQLRTTRSYLTGASGSR
jgi:hypothetical protein